MPDRDCLHDVAAELLEAATAQGVWEPAEGGLARWVTLALPATLLDRLAAGIDDA